MNGNRVFEAESPAMRSHGFCTDEDGQDLIEYALVACLIGLAAVASLKGVGTKVAAAFASIASSLTSAI